MLFYSGFIPRLGDVDEGNTVMDYLPAERERGITIQSAAITFPWRDHRLNLIDTPGHADFTFEVERALRVLDGAVTILDAVAGVEAQTEKVWRQANGRQIPRLIFVNKMDRTGAGFGRTVREVAGKLNCRPLTLQLPIFETELDGGEFIGIVDILRQECLVWSTKSDGKSVEVTPLHQYDNRLLVDEVSRAREALVETLSELDETVVNAYLECEDASKIPIDILKASIRRQTLASQVVPVLAGASFRNIGVQPLLDAIIDYLPAPSDRPAPTVTEDGRPSSLQKDALPCALAFKVIVDQQRGPMVFVRVYSGTIPRGAVLFNNTTRTKERALKILQMSADDAREIPSVEAGNIAVILGLKDTRTGDTLTLARNNKKTIQLQPIDIPPPVFMVTLETTSASEGKALDAALDSLLREDPSLRVWQEEETGQTLLGGMGELHLDIALHKLTHDFKARVEMGTLRIGYRETIHHSASICETYERLVGGTRSSVTLDITASPLAAELAVTRKADVVDGNVVDIVVPETASALFSTDEARLALRNGAAAALTRGFVLGYPLHSVHVSVRVSQYEADSTIGVLGGAAHALVTKALKEVSVDGMAVLEPIMMVAVSVQGSSLGAVMNDLSGVRGGHIVSLDETSETRQQSFEVYAPPDSTDRLKQDDSDLSIRTIVARVPLKETIGYSKALRSLTGGRGNFTMSVASFERMTQRKVQQLREESAY